MSEQEITHDIGPNTLKAVGFGCATLIAISAAWLDGADVVVSGILGIASAIIAAAAWRA